MDQLMSLLIILFKAVNDPGLPMNLYVALNWICAKALQNTMQDNVTTRTRFEEKLKDKIMVECRN
jgi:hypothetical protein